jgi:hypothetical protein
VAAAAARFGLRVDQVQAMHEVVDESKALVQLDFDYQVAELTSYAKVALTRKEPMK